MNRYLQSIIITLTTICVGHSQTTSDFESFGITQDTFLNGSDGSGGFTDGNIRLINNFNDAYNSWAGWAISTTTDTETPGFTNQYSSITGSGVNGSATYATAFVSGESLLHTVDEGRGGVVEGLYINNSTYAALSMLDGDNYAKKFGGEDGTDPDFFFVSIKEYGSRNVNNDSIVFYLADYRFDNSSDDYIIDEWTYIDLTQFGNVDTLSFKLYSSDIGQFGINTPAYFCIDNVITTDMALTSTDDLESQNPLITLYPNPTHGDIWVENTQAFNQYKIVNLMGQQIQAGSLENGIQQLNLGLLDRGQYLLYLIGDAGLQTIQAFHHH